MVATASERRSAAVVQKACFFFLLIACVMMIVFFELFLSSSLLAAAARHVCVGFGFCASSPPKRVDLSTPCSLCKVHFREQKSPRSFTMQSCPPVRPTSACSLAGAGPAESVRDPSAATNSLLLAVASKNYRSSPQQNQSPAAAQLAPASVSRPRNENPSQARGTAVCIVFWRRFARQLTSPESKTLRLRRFSQRQCSESTHRGCGARF